MKKRRILLVDDELAILLTLRAILEMNGFEVDTAASAKEAQNKLKSGVYEMVIADMRMESETSGYDVIHAARQQPYDPATALLTAYPSLGNEWKTRGSAVSAGETDQHCGTAAPTGSAADYAPGPQDAGPEIRRQEECCSRQRKAAASSRGEESGISENG